MSLPEPALRRRRYLKNALKAASTVAVFALLLGHPIEVDGVRTSVWHALADKVATLSWAQVAPYLVAAALLKAVGVACAMLRWHLLLRGQGLAFNFGHIVGSFLIGRFLGTFLPGTLGLDGYKLYDATRYSGRVAEPVAATAVEKLMGLCGMALTYVLSAPFGYAILGEAAGLTLAVTVPLALSIAAGVGAVLWRPALLLRLIDAIAGWAPRRLQWPLKRLSEAAAAYHGQGPMLTGVAILSFLVHFTTASMYVLTALAVGAAGVHFGEVVFASSIQILATVLSPLTIAGEGVRELVQALLLAKRLGTSNSILSAALGFWAAEALTLVGAIVLWSRGEGYAPRRAPRSVGEAA
ncbi:MAG TPA: lysylphosphatidylglycerol synthase transmembrane domain-containing protein [Myxococcota bacterium]|nr:lysylphosphatidylglycerol synthase transmembrane domain-containing protein [Myxococcota bacterium]